MSKLSNKDVVSKYRISNTTVLKWIENALLNKNNLQVQKIGQKYYILDTEHNHSELLNLSGNAMIYRNKIACKRVVVPKEICDLFSYEELLELTNSIKLHRYIPIKFTYLGDKGAKTWKKYGQVGAETGTYQASPNTLELLDKIFPLLKKRLKHNQKINIVDVGTGDSQSMLGLTQNFIDLKILNKYIGIDISDQILEISKDTILNLNKKINYEKHIFDIEKSDFRPILAKTKNKDILNLIFFVGGDTVGNMENIRRTLENFRYSLDEQDIFIIGNKLENPQTRTWFLNDDKDNPHIWLTKDLGIDTDKCEMIKLYDTEDKYRKRFFELDKDYLLQFKTPELEVEIALYKGERILFWKHQMSNKKELFSQLIDCELDILDCTTSQDLNHILVVTKTKNL